MNKKIVVIIIILLVLILCGGIGYTYFFTDALKTDKQLFFKYVSENSEIIDLFQDEDLENYAEKQQNTAYTSNGSIVIDNSSGISFSSNVESEFDTAKMYCDSIATNQSLNASSEEETTENTDESEENLDKEIVNAINNDFEVDNIIVNATYLEEGNSTIILTYTDGSTVQGILNDGEIVWETANLATETYDLKNSSITFTTSTDKANNYVYKNINLNYSDDESLNLEYINNQDYYGVKIDDVVNKYITIENNNLKEFAQILELDDETIEAIPDKIDFDELFSSDLLFTEEELSQLKSTYTEVLYEILTDDMFIQTETASTDIKIYTLTITEEQFYNIAVKVLEQVKEDDIIFNKISEIMTSETDYSESEIDEYINQMKDSIQEYIDELNEEITNLSIDVSNETEENLVINVYVNNKKLTKTEFVIGEANLSIIKEDNSFSFKYLEDESSDAYTLNIAKTKSEDGLDFTVSGLTGETQVFDLDVNFSGMTTDQVNEKSTFAVSYDEYDLSYTYTNTKNFVSQISQDVTTDDMLVLNTATGLSNIENLFEQITTRLDEVNSEQMSNLGLDENPMMYYVPSVVPVLGVYGLQTGSASAGVALGGAVGTALVAQAKTTVDSALSASDSIILASAKETCESIVITTTTEVYVDGTTENTDDILDEKIIESINEYDWDSDGVTCTAVYISGNSTISLEYEGEYVEGILSGGKITWNS